MGRVIVIGRPKHEHGIGMGAEESGARTGVRYEEQPARDGPRPLQALGDAIIDG